MRRIDFIGAVTIAFTLGASIATTLKEARADRQLSGEQRAAIELIKLCGGDLTIDMLSAQRSSITQVTCSVPLPEQEEPPRYLPSRTLVNHE